jgi:hypothetical protein
MSYLVLLFSFFINFLLSKEIILINEEFFVILAFGTFVFFFYYFANEMISDYFEFYCNEIRYLFQAQLNRKNQVLEVIKKNNAISYEFVAYCVVFFNVFFNVRKHSSNIITMLNFLSFQQFFFNSETIAYLKGMSASENN